ncbi:MAG: carboxypeptidase regulatory-like domain-containing protein [Acidobacteria bacterium]|nr:carboxypeptidase regulatory-like domain-containing protein [Acidobacteriota bacterium]
MSKHVLILLAALAGGPLLAQNITGTVLGRVHDASGAAVPNAEVTVTTTATGDSVKVRTDAQGAFLAPYLKPGTYTVQVSAPGFQTAVRGNVLVQVDDQIRLDYVLQLGEVSTTISITATVPLVDTEKGSLGQVVSERTISELPMQGRNVFDLVGLTAGVQTNPLGEGRVISSGSANGLAIFNAADISINGGRYRTNEFLLDGVSIMLPVQNQFALSPTPDGTQEFKVMTNSYGPQFGRSGGGVVNVITKGGSNEFHGSAYEYFRNDRLTANNFFANARGQARGIFRFNMFGGTVGGPAIRNRTFFFADYQGHREGTSFGGRSLTIPTEAQRRGDFVGLLNARGQRVIIYDPMTTRRNPGGTGYLRDAYPGNIIPQNRIDPVAARMQTYLPLPNRPGEGPANINNWVYAPKENTRSDQWSVRLDHRFSERHSLFGRFTRNTGNSLNSGEFGTVADTQRIEFVNDTFNTVLNGTYVFSASSVFSYRLGATRRDGNQITAPAGSVSLTGLGFPAAISAKSQKEAFPLIGVTGYAQFGTPPDAPQTNDIYTIVAEQTHIRGRHTLTYGADLRMYRQNVFRPTSAAGAYNFTRGFTQGPDPTCESHGRRRLGLVSNGIRQRQYPERAGIRGGQRLHSGLLQ